MPRLHADTNHIDEKENLTADLNMLIVKTGKHAVQILPI